MLWICIRNATESKKKKATNQENKSIITPMTTAEMNIVEQVTKSVNVLWMRNQLECFRTYLGLKSVTRTLRIRIRS